MRLVAEKPSRHEQAKYKIAAHRSALYRAAARLWAKGVDMASAISIVESAMKDAGELN